MTKTDELIAYLVNWGFDHGFGVTFTDQLPASLAGFSSQKDKAVWINTSWRNKPEYGFVVAHEMGHLIDGDEGINRYSSPSLSIKNEYAANVYGVKLIKNYASRQDIEINNRTAFCQTFGIPLVLADLI